MSHLPAMVQPSWPSTLAFVTLVFGLCVWLALSAARAGRALGESAQQQRRVGVRTGLACLAFLTLTALASASGILEMPSMPPPLAGFMLVSLGVPLAAACSAFGLRLVRGVSVAALVGVQAFRLPLELVLHAWQQQGVLPIQMTWQGRNLDIVTGILALGLGLWLRKHPNARIPVWFFNVIGFALLINVASIAMLSSPLPIRRFLNDPPVLLAFHAPYGWIVPFCVGGALFLHVLTFRWLLAQRAERAEPRLAHVA